MSLLFDDAAQSFPVPFARAELARGLDPQTAQDLVDQVTLASDADTVTFQHMAARRLGRPDGGSLSSLPRIQPHHLFSYRLFSSRG